MVDVSKCVRVLIVLMCFLFCFFPQDKFFPAFKDLLKSSKDHYSVWIRMRLRVTLNFMNEQSNKLSDEVLDEDLH